MSTPLTTADFMYRARTVHGSRLALVDESGVPGALGTLSYGDLAARCDGTIAALEAMGVRTGARVAIISPNAGKLLLALHAVTGGGRILVPINFRLSAEEVQYIVDDSGAELLLIDPELMERFDAVRVPRRIVMDGDQDDAFFGPDDSGREWPSISEDAVATLNYTSGTTAKPKGVMLSHRSHWLNAVVVGWGFGLGPRDRYLHTLPLFHVNGWGMHLVCAGLGIPNVIQRGVRGPEILRRVDAHRITVLCGATPVAVAIREAAEELRTSGHVVPGAGVTRMISGGAPTPPALIEAFERSTDWEMIQAYGLTETGPVLTVNRVPLEDPLGPPERAERLTAAGAPLLGVRLATTADGEILARTAKAMDGYWEQPELSQAAFREGWLATGDGGHFAQGILRVTDRKKDVIVTGGENVSSLEVEACLHAHPNVREAAVVGVPHSRWGETPKAFVVLRTDATVEPMELVEFCRERLAHFKCPTSVEIRSELPRTATGKIQKFLLRSEHRPT